MTPTVFLYTSALFTAVDSQLYYEEIFDLVFGYLVNVAKIVFSTVRSYLKILVMFQVGCYQTSLSFIYI